MNVRIGTCPWDGKLEIITEAKRDFFFMCLDSLSCLARTHTHTLIMDATPTTSVATHRRPKRKLEPDALASRLRAVIDRAYDGIDGADPTSMSNLLSELESLYDDTQVSPVSKRPRPIENTVTDPIAPPDDPHPNDCILLSMVRDTGSSHEILIPFGEAGRKVWDIVIANDATNSETWGSKEVNRTRFMLLAEDSRRVYEDLESWKEYVYELESHGVKYDVPDEPDANHGSYLSRFFTIRDGTEGARSTAIDPERYRVVKTVFWWIIQ